MKTKAKSNEPKQARRHVSASTRRTRKRRNDPPRQVTSEPEGNGHDAAEPLFPQSEADEISYGQQLVARLKTQEEWVACTELELGQLVTK
jgi:hypothetical protein